MHNTFWIKYSTMQVRRGNKHANTVGYKFCTQTPMISQQLFTLKKSKTSNFQKLCRARVSSGINSYALVFHHRHREWTPEGKTNTITAGPNCMQLNSAKVYTNQEIHT